MGGDTWGDKGFFQLKRGVNMCGIGHKLVIVECSKVAGPTDAPKTTQPPCFDRWGNCPKMAKNGECYRHLDTCPKSCGLCPGMTPHASVTCYDTSSSCKDFVKDFCYRKDIKKDCKKSCGLCKGMTPAASNTCYDWQTPSFCRSEIMPTKCHWKFSRQICRKSCGLCPGMTPVRSNTCYDDYYHKCPKDKAKCTPYYKRYCANSCGLC